MQRGPVAASGAVDRLGGRLVNGQDVVAVDVDSRHSVAGAAAGHAGVAGRVGKGHLGRELVVLAHEQHRQLPDAGQVEPFVEGAVVDGAVAEEGDGHLLGLEHLETVSGPGGLKDARADDAAGTHHAGFRGEQVHAAAASLRTAGRAAEQLGEQLPRRNALGQRVPVPAVRAEDDVVAAQVRTNARGDRFLARRRYGRPHGSARAGALAPVALRSAGSGPCSDKGTRAGRGSDGSIDRMRGLLLS